MGEQAGSDCVGNGFVMGCVACFPLKKQDEEAARRRWRWNSDARRGPHRFRSRAKAVSASVLPGALRGLRTFVSDAGSCPSNGCQRVSWTRTWAPRFGHLFFYDEANQIRRSQNRYFVNGNPKCDTFVLTPRAQFFTNTESVIPWINSRCNDMSWLGPRGHGPPLPVPALHQALLPSRQQELR